MLKLFIYDSDCLICDKFVQFIIKHDRKKEIKFTSNKGTYVKSIKGALNLDDEMLQASSIFLKNGICMRNADAIISIFEELNIYQYLIKVIKFSPKYSRDFLYRIFAKYRYLIFGNVDKCELMNKAELNRFLD